MKKRWLLVLLCVLLLVVGLSVAGYRLIFPYGYSHCCDKVLMFALLEYADEHGGAFPTGEASPEASLSLLYPKHANAYVLGGKTVPDGVAEEILGRGERLAPESCGWHYVEGLRKDDDPRLGLVWDKVAGLGHNGNRWFGGGRVVIFVDGSMRRISGEEWPAFLVEQERLLAARKK
jgi:hypothetical protein